MIKTADPGPFHLISYDAGKDDEISFKKGDRITDVELLVAGEMGTGTWTEDRWKGKNGVGEVGLFPGELFLGCCIFGDLGLIFGYA